MELFKLQPSGHPAQWRASDKGSAALLRLADVHYTRQTKGSNQFCRPGKNLCLLLSDGLAGWVVWRPLPWVGRMDNLEAWECTFFSNKGDRLSSDLIREATRLTYGEWGWPPRDGLITSVGVEQTKARRSKRSPPGCCFIKAEWTPFEKGAQREDDRRVPYEIDKGKVWFVAPRPAREARETA